MLTVNEIDSIDPDQNEWLTFISQLPHPSIRIF